MNNISYNDFKNICRMCMLSCDIKFAQDNIITDVFYKLTDIHFESNVELPQHICQKCFHKINEIHEFAFQCIQTHSSLLQCLNNFKNPQMKKEPDIPEETYEPFNKTEEEITIDEHKIKVELKLKDEEDKNIEFEQIIIPGTSLDQNINCSEDELMKQNTPNYEIEMKDHLRTLNDECPFKCEHCSKSFSRSSYLKMHMHVHSDDRPKKCSQCSKSFKQTTKLKIHMRTHTGERPNKCKQCSKSFAQASSLNRHMRSHSQERPYKCEHCLKTYKQSSNLKIHMRTFHNT